MSKQIVVYEENRELERINFSGGYNITVANNEDGGNLKHFRRLDNGKFDDKHWIKNFIYRPIAEKLVKKFDELGHIKPGRILFIEDTEWEPRDGDKRPWQARIRKANKQLEAMTGYWYVIETRRYFTDNMSKEQVIALLYHELRHIDRNGEIIPHDVEEWSNIIATLGIDWNSRKSQIIDILELDEWNELPGIEMQMGFFGDRPLRAVK